MPTTASSVNRVLGRLARGGLPPLALLALVIALWHAVVTSAGIQKFVFPAPWDVAQSVARKWPLLLDAALITAAAAAAGLACSVALGVGLALVFSLSPTIRRSCYPYAVFFQTVPIVAIAPLVIQALGYGFTSVVVVAHVISLFPILTNTTTGLISVDPELVDLFRLYRASRWRQLWKLRFPHAIPHLVTGVKISCGLAVVGAIVGEFYAGYGGGRHGLGYWIFDSASRLDSAFLVAAVVASSLLGLGLFGAASLVGDVLLARWTKKE